MLVNRHDDRDVSENTVAVYSWLCSSFLFFLFKMHSAGEHTSLIGQDSTNDTTDARARLKEWTPSETKSQAWSDGACDSSANKHSLFFFYNGGGEKLQRYNK